MLLQDLQKAFYISYIVISLFLVLILLGIFILPANFIFQISHLLKINHTKACPLCGMSSAFIEISRGNFSAADQMNAASLLLFFLMAGNSLVMLGIFFNKLRKGKRTK